MILLDLGEDEPEPHPELVASIRPTPRQVTEAILHAGLFPEVPKFYPVEVGSPGSGPLASLAALLAPPSRQDA